MALFIFDYNHIWQARLKRRAAFGRSTAAVEAVIIPVGKKIRAQLIA
jgi:hypothetical protein